MTDPELLNQFRFLLVPVGGCKLSCHGKADYVLVPVMKAPFTCHGAFYKQ